MQRHTCSPPTTSLRSLLWLALLFGGLFVLMAGTSNNAHAVLGLSTTQTQQGNEILVRFKRTTSNATRQQVLGAAGCVENRRFRLVNGLALVSNQSGTGMATTLARLRGSSAVLYAEPNYIVTAAMVPETWVP